MGFVKFFNNKKIEIFIPILFVVISFFMTITRTPFYDEARAFVFSYFSLNELIQITRIEGHPLTWYLLLKLINKNINFYPYSILLLNWFISSLVIFFFWKKAKISKIFKVAILLSYPFLNYYFIVVRPYALTILFLFFLAYYFEKCTKSPIFYSLILSICMNITVIGAIGAFGFLIIFLKKIIEQRLSKKDFILSFLIFLFATIIFYFQFYSPQIPDKVESMNILIKNNLFYYFVFPFKDFFIKPVLHNIFQIYVFILFYWTLFFYIKKNRYSLIFLITSYVLLSLTFLNVYCGGCWHHFFYFVFFVISIWLAWDEINKTKIYKFVLLIFLLLTIFPLFYFEKKEISVLNETKYYAPILDRILNDDEIKKSKLFCFEKNSYITPGLLPYLRKHNVYLYDIQGAKWGSFDSYMKTYSRKNINLDKIENFVVHLAKDKNNYLLVNNLSDTNIPKTIIFNNNKHKITLKMVDIIKESIFAIYKIEVEEII